MRRVLAIVGAAAAFGASSAGAVQTSSWSRIRTAHVELLTDGSPETGRTLGRELERFERTVSSLAPAPGEDVPPIVLYAFRDLDSFRPFLPEFRGRAQEVGGFAQVGEDGAIAALDLTADDDRTATAFHELTHLLLGRFLPPPPPWLAEGLAEYFSAARREPGALVVGVDRPEHIRRLQRDPLLPLAELLRVDYGSPLYNEGDRRSVFYAESWALVHLLLERRDASPRAALAALGDVARDTDDPVAALGRLTGEEIAATEQRLREYVARGVRPEWRIEHAAEEAEVEPLIEPVPRAEAECRLGQLLMARGRAPEASPYLERALRIDPDYVPAHLALAALHAQQLEFAKAREHVERARRLQPDDPKTLYRYADLLVKEGLHRGTPLSAGDETAAAGALERALARAPWFAEAAELLVSIQDDEPGRTDALLAVVRRAVALNPSRARLHLTLARLYARKQDVAGARTALRHARESRDEVTRLVAQLATRQVDEFDARTAEVRGTLMKLGCLPDGGLDFVVFAGGRSYRLRAPSPRGVFLYRPSGEPVELTLTCGAQQAAVVARYAPEPGLVEGVEGRILSLTFR
jgi:tetratricopeptide (TPR) repeat protein